MHAPYKLFDFKMFAPKAKPQTFTPDLSGLIAWLETQDGATTYNWGGYDDCLLMRFSKAAGNTGELYGDFLNMSVRERSEIAAPLGDWTYAAALSRARALHTKAAE